MFKGFKNIWDYSLLLNNQTLTKHIHKFWNDLFKNITKNTFIALLIVVEYSDSSLKTLGKASKVTSSDLNDFTKNMINYLSFKDNQYFTKEVRNLHFMFKFIPKDQLLNNESIIHPPRDKYVLTTSKMFG